MTSEALIVRIQQHAGNRAAPSGESTFYVDRLNEAYNWVTTYRRAGRALKFFEFYDRLDRVLGASPADNFYAFSAGVRQLEALYDETNGREIPRKSARSLMRRNLNDTGDPTMWVPYGAGNAAGYMVYPQPASSISVVEYNYMYAETLADDATEPVIPEEWHRAIHLAGGALTAEQFGMPDEANGLWNQAHTFIDTHRTPVEETGDGGLRQIHVGRHYPARGRGRF
jgi:hypothetical protein